MKFLHVTIAATITLQEHIHPKQKTILANATQIHQVIINLCTNGVQAMEDHGGILDISLSTTELTAPDLQQRSQHSQILPTGSENILVVDDEPLVAEVIQLRLQRLGYTVTALSSSYEALALFSSDQDKFDLVHADCVGMNRGADFVKLRDYHRPDHAGNNRGETCSGNHHSQARPANNSLYRLQCNH